MFVHNSGNAAAEKITNCNLSGNCPSLLASNLDNIHFTFFFCIFLFEKKEVVMFHLTLIKAKRDCKKTGLF